MKAIFAQSQNGFIGKDNGLLFSIPEDMKYFREQTKGATVIMGRKTWDSLPDQYKPLPGRLNIILTSERLEWMPNTECVHPSGDEFQSLMRTVQNGWCIGGEQTYNLCMPWVDEIHQTVVFKDFEGDTKAPVIDLTQFTLVSSSAIKSHEGLDYQFNVYTRTSHGYQETNT